MFVSLKLSMFNSIGTRIAVNLFRKSGKIEYEILFPGLGVEKTQRNALSKSASERFLKKLKKNGTLDLIHQIRLPYDPKDNDTWSLEVDFGDNDVVRASGPDVCTSDMRPVLQDLAEILDNRFPVLQLVSPTRIERLMLGFCFNEFNESMTDIFPELQDMDHMESITLDRKDRVLVYSKRFPASCFNSIYVCRCEQQVRSILDQSSDILTDEVLFEDIDSKPGEPTLAIYITYHDGSIVRVSRALSRRGLRDRIYFELLDVIHDTVLHLLLKGGLLDKRFLGSEDEIMKAPFTVSYNEDDTEAM